MRSTFSHLSWFGKSGIHAGTSRFGSDLKQIAPFNSNIFHPFFPKLNPQVPNPLSSFLFLFFPAISLPHPHVHHLQLSLSFFSVPSLITPSPFSPFSLSSLLHHSHQPSPPCTTHDSDIRNGTGTTTIAHSKYSILVLRRQRFVLHEPG